MFFQMANKSDQTITTEQAATMLEITTVRVAQLAADRKLPATKIGRKWFFRAADVKNHKRGKGGRPAESQTT